MQNTEALTRLALDLSWSWNHSADEIWQKLDLELWELTVKPWLIRQSTSPEKLARLRDNPSHEGHHAQETQPPEGRTHVSEAACRHSRAAEAEEARAGTARRACGPAAPGKGRCRGGCPQGQDRRSFARGLRAGANGQEARGA
jgi:hypothetical protein